MSIVAEFVTLTKHPTYEILTVYPYTIRRRDNHHVMQEHLDHKGYYIIRLMNENTRGTYRKHRLVAEQFIPNPNNFSQVDHINHNRQDNHIENLRWCNQSTNQNNQSSYNGVSVKYVDDIPNEAIVVDFYDTRTERHEFEKYFYYEGTFYYDTGMNYRILNVNETKTGCKHVHMHDKNNKQVSLVITRFLQQYDLI